MYERFILTRSMSPTTIERLSQESQVHGVFEGKIVICQR